MSQQFKNAAVACLAVGLLAGRRCLSLAGVRFEPDTGANSTAATPPAGQGNATPPAQTQAAPAPANDQAGMMQTLGAAIGSAISQAIAPIQQAVTQQGEAQNQILQGMTGPARNAQSTLFGGGAPGIRQGEDPLSSRGYEFCRAAAVRLGFLGRDEAKVEMSVHNRLHEYFVAQRAMELDSTQSILVPLGSAFLPQDIDAGFRQEVGQLTRQSVQGADWNQIGWMRRQSGLSGGVRQALSQYDDTGFGNLLGSTSVAGELIGLLRAKEAFTRAGATDFALPANGRIKFNKLTGAMTAYWVGEANSGVSSATLTASTPTSGEILLSAKKLATLVKYPNELLRFGGPTIEAIFRDDMTRVMALKADRTMIDGEQTTVTPKGLLNYSINSITAGTVGTNGNTIDPEDLALMMAEVEEDNVDIESDSFAWLMRPRLHAQILNKRGDGGGGAGTGPFMFELNREDVAKGFPMQLIGYPVVKSTQIPNNRTKGSGTDLSCLIGGCFKHWLIGRIGVVEFAMSNQGDTAFTTDQTWMRAIQHIDFAPRHEQAFVVCDDLVIN